MDLAVLSVSALAVAVLVSCVSRINVGVLAVALAWIVGVLVGGLPSRTVMDGFPGSLFLTLAGVTLLFAMAQANGTLDGITRSAVRLCRGNRGLIPLMFFVLGAGLASMGPGNIATAALVAPLAMSTAVRTRIPLFLMAIMVGNGANAGSLSPFAPTGIIVNQLMARNGLGGFEWQTYASNLLAHTLVAGAGYLLFGGPALLREGGSIAAAGPGDEPVVLTRQHWTTICVIVGLILAVLFGGVNVGLGAFLGAVLLVLAGAGDDVRAMTLMPWRVIMMVCGVTVLISLVQQAEGIDLLVSMVSRVSSAESVTATAAFLTGIVSVYSSTSGVVLPAFLPMVPGLAAALPGSSALAIAMAMNIGGHLVDVSPLSTIGALCVAGAGGEGDRALFNKLLAWGLSMSIFGAILAFLLGTFLTS